jgi:hypothetical protein
MNTGGYLPRRFGTFDHMQLNDDRVLAEAFAQLERQLSMLTCPLRTSVVTTSMNTQLYSWTAGEMDLLLVAYFAEP